MKALEGLHLFRTCTRGQLTDLLPSTDVIAVAEGTVLDRAGAFSRQFVGIVDGFVEAIDASGRPAVLGPGDHYGAAELFDGLPHSATYTAITPCTLVVTFGPTFRAAARSLPAVVVRSANRMGRRTNSQLTLVG